MCECVCVCLLAYMSSGGYRVWWDGWANGWVDSDALMCEFGGCGRMRWPHDCLLQPTPLSFLHCAIRLTTA